MSMLHKAIQNRWCRLALAVAATLLYAIGVNWFIVPMGLYTGGLLGFCQVARTLIVEALGLSPNVDFSGILYLAANVPILLLAWRVLGKGFLVRTAVCTVTSSLFLSLVPPAAPLVEETLTNCVLGGILVGFSLGIVLTCGCSTGGLDILGLWLAKKGKGFSVGALQPELQRAALHALRGPLRSARGDLFHHLYGVLRALHRPRAPAEHHRAGAHLHQGRGPRAAEEHHGTARARRDLLGGARAPTPARICACCACASPNLRRPTSTAWSTSWTRTPFHHAGGRDHPRKLHPQAVLKQREMPHGISLFMISCKKSEKRRNLCISDNLME